MNLQSHVAIHYKKRGRILARSIAGKDALHSSRRGFLQSLSRTALVLSLEGVLALAKPSWLRAGLVQAEQEIDFSEK